jgi:hypothetical protein
MHALPEVVHCPLGDGSQAVLKYKYPDITQMKRLYEGVDTQSKLSTGGGEGVLVNPQVLTALH